MRSTKVVAAGSVFTSVVLIQHVLILGGHQGERSSAERQTAQPDSARTVKFLGEFVRSDYVLNDFAHGKRYRFPMSRAYAPAFILHDDEYHAIFCSADHTDHATRADPEGYMDLLLYASSPDGRYWSKPKIVLWADDKINERSTCDSSIVFFKGYFYLFYTGNAIGVEGCMFVARSRKISGPYEKYIGQGRWSRRGGAPHRIIGPYRPGVNYGAGQQTVIVKDGKLHAWYSDSVFPETNKQVRHIVYCSSEDGLKWTKPVHLREADGGPLRAFSVDVKYNSTARHFEMYYIEPEHYEPSSLCRRLSKDGVNWSAKQTVVPAEEFPNYAHNVGVLSDTKGWLLDQPLSIAFGAPDIYVNPDVRKQPIHGVSLFQISSKRFQTTGPNSLYGMVIGEPLFHWDFSVGDINKDGVGDLIGVQEDGPEAPVVVVLDGRSQYQTCLFRRSLRKVVGTPEQIEYVAADYNRDGVADLWRIRKSGTASGKTEVEIFSGTSQFQRSLQTARLFDIGTTDERWQFLTGDYNRDGFADLIMIAKRDTGSGKTEVHIYDGRSRFRRKLLAKPLPDVEFTDGRHQFASGYYNDDRVADLYMISKRDTATGKTVVHIYDGASEYQRKLLSKPLPGIGFTDEKYSFLVENRKAERASNVFMIIKSGTTTRLTDVQIFNGAKQFQQFLLQVGASLEQGR